MGIMHRTHENFKRSPEDVSFLNLRRRLCLSFMALAFVVFVSSSLVSGLFVQRILTAGLNDKAPLSTQGREAAIQVWLFNQCLVMALVLPIVVWISYVITSMLTHPIKRNMELFRNFTQDAGHELATPISILRSRLQLMQVDLERHGNCAEHLIVLNEAVARMSALIEDLRMLADSNSPTKYLQLSLIDLDSLVRTSILHWSPQFAAKDMQLKAGKIEPAELIGDPDGLSRALENLIVNALRYGHAGGCVTVTLADARNHVVLSVIDNGSGIAENSLPHIFERFYRGDFAGSREIAGTGLGLPIVKAIVEAHDGTVDVRSRIGHGAEFIIKLPKIPRKHPALASVRKKGDVDDG